MLLENAYVTIDDTDFPLIVQRLTGQDPTPETFDEYLEALLRLAKRGDKVVMLVDATRAQFLSAEYRVKLTRHFQKHERLLEESTVCYAFVIRTLIVRFVLNAIMKVQRLPAPHRIFDSREKARLWAEAQIVGAPTSLLAS